MCVHAYVAASLLYDLSVYSHYKSRSKADRQRQEENEKQATGAAADRDDLEARRSVEDFQWTSMYNEFVYALCICPLQVTVNN